MVTGSAAFGIGKRREWFPNGKPIMDVASLLFGTHTRPVKLQLLAGMDLSNFGTRVVVQSTISSVLNWKLTLEKILHYLKTKNVKNITLKIILRHLQPHSFNIFF